MSIVTVPGEGFRAYYRGLPTPSRAAEGLDVTAYATSTDGVTWSKPADNIVLREHAPASHNLNVFYDLNPAAPAEERWKAVGGIQTSGLRRFVSADGVNWTPFMAGEPMMPITDDYRYDSLNVVFWSEAEAKYVCYYRSFRDFEDGRRVRWVSRATSLDFVTWHDEGPMAFLDADGDAAPPEQIYTNQTTPYFRAPHLYVGIAGRLVEGRQVVTDGMAARLGVDPDYYRDVSDGVLLTTRGDLTYQRTFVESFLRPGPGWENWTSRNNYPALGIIPTGPREMSFFVQRRYGQPDQHMARYTLRTDGFASLHAGYKTGEWLSRPIRFSGNRLEINYATSAAGSLRFELQDAAGEPIDGFALADSRLVVGDEIAGWVDWQGEVDLSALAGRVVRLRIELQDADLFAFAFATEEANAAQNSAPNTIQHEPTHRPPRP
ncbi:hypothetical protein [Actomonas aquatica]|uniref:Uncharacterized protein n=1 Tax=Actomonas aquatica TaxID=2866162 RepID=A0ABZ1C1X3_9BACT|nr:hypothetical protein [Opitutus sp. WL0086]WRQ85510.1 hypothetical protein K1X11_011925 [Opitutus sp. WL0086]